MQEGREGRGEGDSTAVGDGGGVPWGQRELQRGWGDHGLVKLVEEVVKSVSLLHCPPCS